MRGTSAHLNQLERLTSSPQPRSTPVSQTKTYLITGGCGFIGTNFVRRVMETRPNWQVINLDAGVYWPFFALVHAEAEDWQTAFDHFNGRSGTAELWAGLRFPGEAPRATVPAFDGR